MKSRSTYHAVIYPFKLFIQQVKTASLLQLRTNDMLGMTKVTEMFNFDTHNKSNIVLELGFIQQTGKSQTTNKTKQRK